MHGSSGGELKQDNLFADEPDAGHHEEDLDWG
jgi:hypothetical protein